MVIPHFDIHSQDWSDGQINLESRICEPSELGQKVDGPRLIIILSVGPSLIIIICRTFKKKIEEPKKEHFIIYCL